MPQFNLRVWPNTGEQPDGLYKPFIDRDDPFWSPVVRLLCRLVPEGDPTGHYQWFLQGVATASMHNGSLRYTSVATADGSYAVYEITGRIPDLVVNQWYNSKLLYYPPTAVWPDPVLFEDQISSPSVAPGGLTRMRQTSEASLKNGPGPPCDTETIAMQIGTRAVDPLDYDVPLEVQYRNSCDPI